MNSHWIGPAALLAAALFTSHAYAEGPTPGYPEPVVQWGVQKGETCDHISKVLYGSSQYASLVQRYNRVACGRTVFLPEGLTLVLPASPTHLPDARVRSMRPDVMMRPSGGAWTKAAPGAPLFSNYNVNALEKANADIEFVDRSRILLGANTLVVIYGTAARSKVGKTTQPSVELNSGEIKAGLAALRGDSVDIAIEGGGSVSASSRDAVIARKGARTTVAVFDGKADVRSGGATISVPKHFGTRFVGAERPAPPRPLPPAPLWEDVDFSSVVLASPEGGQLNAAWKPEPSAVSYRFEVARDEDFHDIVVREEVPSRILAFRAEKMPPGAYFLSVRAIDKDDYLGIPATTRAIRIISVQVEPGQINTKEIVANPYALLSIAPSPGLEMALDDGPFGPVLAAIDLRRIRPANIRFRPRGTESSDAISIKYQKIEARVSAKPSPDKKYLRVEAQFDGFSTVAIEKRVAPSLRALLPSGLAAFPIAVNASGASHVDVPLKSQDFGQTSLRIVDAYGSLLASATADVPAPHAPVSAPEEPRRIGVTAPFVALAPGASLMWWSPTPETSVAFGTTFGFVKNGPGLDAADLSARISGRLSSRIGLDAALGYALENAWSTDSAAWIGARALLLSMEDHPIEFGAALRLGLPIFSGETPLRIEPSLATGKAGTYWSWLANLGVRLRAGPGEQAPHIPAAAPFTLVGGTVNVVSWLRLYGLLDGSLRFGQTQGGRFAGGFSLGAEAGQSFFVGALGRVGIWEPAESGAAWAQFVLGYRAR